MKHLVEIDDGTKIGESILFVLNNLSKTNKSIKFRSLKKIEEIGEFGDPDFTAKVEEGLKNGTVSKEMLMEKLNSILSL